MPPEDNSILLLKEVISKVIDSQTGNTRALTELQKTMEEVGDRTEVVEKFFQNGFRSDLKTLMKQMEELTEIVEKLVTSQHECPISHAKLSESIRSFKDIGFWFKVVAGFFASIGIIVGGVLAILKYLG